MANLRVPLVGFGRNINHDPRSRAYRAARRAPVLVEDAEWMPRIPAMNQGALGRCVPTAGTAMLTCAPFWDTLEPALQRTLLDPVQREAWAVQAYRDVTRLDPFLGAWEPEDTGSDGLSLWRLWRDRGLAGGSEHVMSLEDAHSAIQKGPVLLGISWLANMDNVRSDGTVAVSGANRGGHEVLCYRYEKARDLWWCRNSWGSDWGRRGDFAFDSAGYQRLMDLQADGVAMLPATAPAPVPDLEDAPFPFGPMDAWAKAKKVWWPKRDKAAAEAYLNWKGRVQNGR